MYRLIRSLRKTYVDWIFRTVPITNLCGRASPMNGGCYQSEHAVLTDPRFIPESSRSVVVIRSKSHDSHQRHCRTRVGQAPDRAAPFPLFPVTTSPRTARTGRTAHHQTFDLTPPHLQISQRREVATTIVRRVRVFGSGGRGLGRAHRGLAG